MIAGKLGMRYKVCVGSKCDMGGRQAEVCRSGGLSRLWVTG